MKDTHLYFFYQNINNIFSLKCDIYYALTFILFAEIQLKESNFTPYYLPLI